MSNFKEWLEELNTKKRVLFFLGVVALAALLFFGLAQLVGWFVSAFDPAKSHSNLYYGLSESGLPLTIILFLALVVTLIALFTRKIYRNRVSASDERGVHYMNDNTYGSGRWMQSDEIKNAFEVAPIAQTQTTIYGQLSDDGRKVVGWKPNSTGGSGNRNVFILASMGSGKSFCYVRTELIQAILRGNSFVVTDPSAELYTDIAAFCRSRDVDVRVLNLADPSVSEFWNCLEETIDPASERLDSSRLNDFCSIFMQNSGANVEDFWYNSALNLIKAVIGLTAWQYEKQILDAYIDLYRNITGVGYDDPFILRTKREMISFPFCRQKIRKEAENRGYDLNRLEELFTDITKNAYDKPYNIASVIDNLLLIEQLGGLMDDVPSWHPASIAYKTFKTNDTDNVRKSAIQGATLRFNLFSDNNLKQVFSRDGIHLSDITKRQSAYFVIMSDKSPATKPLSSLFFSFLFKDAQDIYDFNQQKAKAEGTENPCLDLVAMLDEFFSIGTIGGSPEAFGITMSNSRKRHIYISIIVQVYSQVEALYGEQIKDVIQGGCSTLLYLGGNDPGTCEFISQFAAGESTVLTESHAANGLMGGIYNVRADRRALLTVDEARRWKDQVLVVRQGEYPMKLKPFPWTQHPLYKQGKMKPSSIYNDIEPLSERLERIYEAEAVITDPRTRTHMLNVAFAESQKAIALTPVEDGDDLDFIDYSEDDLLALLEQAKEPEKESVPDTASEPQSTSATEDELTGSPQVGRKTKKVGKVEKNDTSSILG